MATALKLYDTTDALLQVRAWVDEHVDEIIAAGGEMPAELAELVDQAEGDFATKVERVGLYIRELVTTAKAVKEEADRLAARAKHMERAAEGLKGYLLLQLQRAEIPSVKGALVTVRRQKSPASVRTTLDVDALRAEFNAGVEWVIEVPAVYKLDARLLLESHKAGRPLPDGVTVEQGEHVRIA